MNLVLFVCGVAIPFAHLGGYPMVVYTTMDELRLLTRLVCGVLITEGLADHLTATWTDAREQAALKKCRGAYYLNFCKSHTIGALLLLFS
jgi:hypothetical protein